MAVQHTNGSEPSIDSVDAFARQLYRRARAAGSDFAEIATAVRSLHTVLKHVRVEADDADSLLNGGGRDGIYSRQLAPVMRDCDLTLQQLDRILEKHGHSSGGASSGGGGGGDDDDDDDDDDDGARALTRQRRRDLTTEERGKLALIQKRLGEQKTSVDMVLDTIQLHSPAAARSVLDRSDSRQLDAIEDKVDATAAGLYRKRKASMGSDTEEDLWQSFRAGLVKEGFSSEVLERNKEVLRAYIRELDEHGPGEDGAPPSMRGLLLEEEEEEEE